MTETSREFWRDPLRHATSDIEVGFGTPSYYTGDSSNSISPMIESVLAASGAQKDWHFLEIGCNCGRNLAYLGQAGYKNAYGVEINPAMVEYAWEVYPGIAEKIRVSDAQSYLAAIPPNKWDVIFTQSVLMHVPPEDEYLFKQIARVASKMILTCEVEMLQKGALMRHKFPRNYREVFGHLGWQQIHKSNDHRRIIRVFIPCQQ